MYNLRYHIASLVAVFLALSVGLLLGTVVVERRVGESTKATLVDRLTEKQDQIMSENQALKRQLDVLDGFSAEASAEIERDLLKGRSILIIGDTGPAETVKQASDAVRAAGGTPVEATLFGPNMGLDDPKARTAAAKALATPEASIVETLVVTVLSREWSTPGDARVLTRALVSARALRLDGLEPTATVGGVIVVASWTGGPDAAAISLAKSLQRPGRFAIGVESVKRPTGMAKAAVDAGLSGVDDVGSSLGRLSTIWVLAGRAGGHFGVQPGSESAYPEPLFPGR